jgi:4-aminobutyrate aminotransferase
VDGKSLPNLVSPIPGPESVSWVTRLAATECPAITARRARRAAETGVGQDPIVWTEALGANVKDADGNVYVDLTSAFAVCGLGHRHPKVVEAAHRQTDRLIHAMGDVYPSDVKVELGESLARVAPGDLQQSILGLSGASSVESALKTAAIHTGKPGAVAFWGGYHGLSIGALAATGYRASFRRPFLGQLNPHITRVPYPDPYRPPFGMPHGTPADAVRDACLAHLRDLLENPSAGHEAIGAVILEPIQGRGGEVVPPAGFLRELRALCDEHDLVLIFDEIYTGFGRTGSMFACESEEVVPDVLCVGKAMGGGFPISAAVGRSSIMESWGASQGEAIHTSTFLGNPLGCAMALAAIEALEDEDWPERVAERGGALRTRLESLADRYPDVVGTIRGRGFMLGLELVRDANGREPDPALALLLTDHCREHGYLVLPSGVWGNVLAVTPPFVITDEQLEGFLEVLEIGVEKAHSSR